MDKELAKRIYLEGTLIEGDVPGKPDNVIVVELDGVLYALRIEEAK